MSLVSDFPLTGSFRRVFPPCLGASVVGFHMALRDDCRALRQLGSQHINFFDRRGLGQ